MNLYSADPHTLCSFFEVVGAGVSVFDVNNHRDVTSVCTNNLFRSLYSSHEGDLAQSLPEDLDQVYVGHARDCSRLRATIDFEHPLALGKKWLSVRMIPVYPEHDVRTVRVFATTVDITAKRRLEKDLQVVNARLSSVIDSSFEGVVTINTNRTIKSFNQAACRIFGYSPDEIVGQQLEKLVPERFRARHPAYVQQFRDSGDEVRAMENRVEIQALRKDGSEFSAEISIAKINVGDEQEFTAFIRDISEHMRLLDELHYRASTDPLTGLQNRRQATEEATNVLVHAQRFSHPTTAILIDIDDFKSINDKHGHHIGDRVLQEVGKVCRNQARQSDIVARWGGEEFLLFLPETDMEGAMNLAERVLENLRSVHTSIEQIGHRRVTASLGVSVFNEGSDTIDSMISRADQAMYNSKKTGKNKIMSSVEVG